MKRELEFLRHWERSHASFKERFTIEPTEKAVYELVKDKISVRGGSKTLDIDGFTREHYLLNMGKLPWDHRARLIIDKGVHRISVLSAEKVPLAIAE